MRQLLYSVMMMTTAAICAAGVCGGPAEAVFIEADDMNDTEEVVDTDSDETYLGDTLYCDGDKLVMYCSDYFTEDYLDFEGGIVTFQGGAEVDTCIVKGHATPDADGNVLKMVVGVDTVRYDILSLPDTIWPERKLMPEEIKETIYKRSVNIPGMPYQCRFVFRAFVPVTPPAWLGPFMSVLIEKGLEEMFTFDAEAAPENLYAEYLERIGRANDSASLGAEAPSLTTIGMRYANNFEDCCTKEVTEFAKSLDESERQDYLDYIKYDYSIEAMPVWANDDGSLVSYRFYIYWFQGGVHGIFEEFNVTFENQSGYLVSFENIYDATNLELAKSVLNEYIVEYLKEDSYMNQDCEEDNWQEYAELSLKYSNLTKEMIGDRIYPRPALTNAGVVFSFQPYELSGFAQGIINFILP